MTDIFDDFYPLEEKPILSHHYAACYEVESRSQDPTPPMSVPVVLDSHEFPCPDEAMMFWHDTLSSSMETPVSTPPQQWPSSWLYAEEELPEHIKGERGGIPASKKVEAKAEEPVPLPTIQLPETPMAILFTLSAAAVLRRGVMVNTTGGRVDFIFSNLRECYAFMQSVRCGWEQFTTDEALVQTIARWIVDFPAPYSRCTPKKPITVTIKARSHGSSRFAAIRAAVEETRTFFRQHSLFAVTVKQ